MSRADEGSVPIPDDGPIAYVSYALSEATMAWLTGVVSELRSLNVRAQFDRLGFLGDNPRGESIEADAPIYRAAVDRSEWFVAFVDDPYLQRARDQAWTGVKTDIANIEARVFRDPKLRERVIAVMRLGPSSPSNAADVIPLFAGLDRLEWRGETDPRSSAVAIRDAFQRQSDAHTRPVSRSLLGQFAPTKLVLQTLDVANSLAATGPREQPRVAVGALVLALLHVGSLDPQQDNSASWFAGKARTTNTFSIRQMLSEYFPRWPEERFGRPFQNETTPAELPLSYNAYSVLYWASLLAGHTATAHARPLRGAHLLLALLHTDAPWTKAVDDSLLKIGLDPAALRGSLAVDIPSWELGGDLPTWNAWNRGSPTVAQSPTAPWKWKAGTDAPGFSPDAPSGDDLLDITPDVEAFAKVLASWDLEPPMALGLFGDWGSGKTFFMQRLRQQIEHLSREARVSPLPQREHPYCKYVVQVEFNAWHYSEGELWACLVDHIFTNLRLSDGESETAVARRRKAMLAQMKTLQNAGANAAARKQEAVEALAAAENEAKAAAEKLAAAQQRFTELSVKDIWAAVTDDPKVREALTKHLAALGVNAENAQSAQEIRAAIDDARGLAGRTREMLRFLGTQLLNPYSWLAFLLALGVPAALLWLAACHLESEARIGASVTAVLGAIVGFLPIYRTFASHAAEILDRLDEPRRMAEAARRIELQQVESRIVALTEQRNEAEDRRRAIEEDAAQLQQRIDELNADRMLAEFLQDRAATDDYRKKLGTLALIRRDFERLAELMASQRVDANAGRLPSDGLDASLRVNRIVLYIDDLDRCASKQVVEVLQAIHLLLAFPLFVVVVGVDARWVQSSIHTRHGEMLRAIDAPPLAAADPGSRATARDYLEKIFQVPFWLKPMQAETCRDLMTGLLRPKPPAPAPEPAPAPTPSLIATAAEDTPRSSAPATTVAVASESQTLAASAAESRGRSLIRFLGRLLGRTISPAERAIAPSPAMEYSEAPRLETPDVVAAAPEQSDAPQPAAKEATETARRPKSLDVTDDELECMRDLADVVGRSPRAVKRFINCYRLFKAVLPDNRVAGFEHGSPDRVSFAEIALSLLALVIGDPDRAATLLQSLKGSKDDDLVGDLAARARSSGSTSPSAHGMLARLTKQTVGLRVGDVRWLVDRAARFSFQ